MALAHTLTRMFPTENEIGIHLIVTDNDRPDLGEGVQEIINETSTRNTPTGDMANKIRNELGLEAQAEIDRYKVLKNRYDNPVYQTKVTQINNTLTL